LAAYEPPNPAAGSGAHSYQVLLLKQNPAGRKQGTAVAVVSNT